MDPETKKGSFAVGDKVFYPSHGLGIVRGIKPVHFTGIHTDCIEVYFPRIKMTAQVPVQNAHQQGLQQLASFASARNIAAAFSAMTGYQRQREINQQRKRENLHDELRRATTLEQIAVVIRDVTPRTGKIIPYSSEQIQKEAVTLFAELVAASEDKALEQVYTQIASIMKKTGREPPRVNTW